MILLNIPAVTINLGITFATLAVPFEKTRWMLLDSGNKRADCASFPAAGSIRDWKNKRQSPPPRYSIVHVNHKGMADAAPCCTEHGKQVVRGVICVGKVRDFEIIKKKKGIQSFVIPLPDFMATQTCYINSGYNSNFSKEIHLRCTTKYTAVEHRRWCWS